MNLNTIKLKFKLLMLDIPDLEMEVLAKKYSIKPMAESRSETISPEQEFDRKFKLYSKIISKRR